MNRENVYPNLNFTVENIMGNLHKANFKLNPMNEIFNFLKFQDFINEFGEICFPLGKMEF